jgi:hypothetical protein
MAQSSVEAVEVEVAVVIKIHTVTFTAIPMLLEVAVVEDNVMALLEVLEAEEMERLRVLLEH